MGIACFGNGLEKEKITLRIVSRVYIFSGGGWTPLPCNN